MTEEVVSEQVRAAECGNGVHSFRVVLPDGEGRCFITTSDALRLRQLTPEWVARAVSTLAASHGSAWLPRSLRNGLGLRQSEMAARAAVLPLDLGTAAARRLDVRAARALPRQGCDQCVLRGRARARPAHRVHEHEWGVPADDRPDRGARRQRRLSVHRARSRRAERILPDRGAAAAPAHEALDRVRLPAAQVHAGATRRDIALNGRRRRKAVSTSPTPGHRLAMTTTTGEPRWT
jgi:hypothetical protein